MGIYTDTPAIMQVIGCIYKNPSLLDETDKYYFSEADFTEEFHKIVFGSIFNLHALGAKEITLTAIEDYLEQRPKKAATFKASKGIEYLQELEKNVQLSTFDYYYNRVKKMTLFREYQKIGLDLSWLYDIDNILDVKKKQAQEDWLDRTSIKEISEIITKKIDDIASTYVDNIEDTVVKASTGVRELVEGYKKRPELGLPLYGKYMNTITRGARLGKFYLRSAATGVGKAIPNDTVIPTPQGWRQVSDIKVGDELFGQDGKSTKVLAVYPQPSEKEIWEVTFSDGRVAKCCGEHLWEYRYETHRGKAYRVEDIQTIYNRALSLKNGLKDSSNKGYRFHIRLNEPVNYSEKEYSVDPYVMGLLLGDGSFRYSDTNKALTFSSADEELPKAIVERLEEKYIYKKCSEYNYNYVFKPESNLTHNLWVEEILKDYPELWQAKSEDKFIPKSYLEGSISQRYDLLAGLLDTDGNIDKKGRVRFTTTSSKLRDDIIELARSLGMVATYLIDKRTEKYAMGECYSIIIQSKKENKPKMFKLPRKLEIAKEYANSNKRNEYKDHLAIVKIEKTTEKTNMTCFTVDNDNHLFLMNDYIVTHNTRAMIADACLIGCDEIWSIEEEKWITTGLCQSTLYIATEQDLGEVQTMMIAFLSAVNEEHILSGEYENGEWERVQKAFEVLEKGKIQFQSMPDFSLADIEMNIKRGIRDYNTHYVFLDYIHTSMKILEEVTRRSGGVKLREDNILFMISIRLKDLCNQYQIFIMSSTQLNASYQESETPDQNLLRGAKSIADKIDTGLIMLETTSKDKEALQGVCQDLGIEMPNVKISVYKNRRGQWKGIYLWCNADRGICRINPIFVTDWNYNIKEITDLKIKLIDASAF